MPTAWAAGWRWRKGQGPLTAAAGFPDQGAVVIRTRQAGDLLGATKMDRPEWIAIDQDARTVYCTLTNNTRRGMPNRPAVDAANPRANNTMGHIIQWTEDGDFDATTFRWKHLLLAGDPANKRPEARGNIRGDVFACPDGLTLDARGVLWIQTDMSSDEMHRGEMKRFGNNQMLACDPATGEVRRFLIGPVGLRDHRHRADARRTHDVRQHPAPGRAAHRRAATASRSPACTAIPRTRGGTRTGPTSGRTGGRARPPSRYARRTAGRSGRESAASGR